MEGVVLAFMFLMGQTSVTHQVDVTTLESCKAQTVKVANSNYSYVTYDHCRK